MKDNIKTAIIINISEDDLILVEAAQELNLKLVTTSNIDPASEREIVRKFYSKLPFYNNNSAYDRQCSSYQQKIIAAFEVFIIKFRHKTNFVIKNSRYSEARMPLLILSTLIPYLRTRISQLPLHWNKYLYLSKLAKNNIKVPSIQQKVNDHKFPKITKIKFPVICKPAYCSGGAGIQLAKNEQDIKQLFGNELNPQNFSDLNLYYRNRNKHGLRNYIYNSGHLSGPYIIQDYIEGRVLSVSGVLTDESVRSIFCYEIFSTKNEYFAEQGFLFPIEKNLEDEIYKLSKELTSILKYPNGPFMIDFILSTDNQLYIIDAAPRSSLTGAMLSRWAFQNNSHAKNIISSHWNKIVDENTENTHGRPVFWQRFPFPKGLVKTIEYPLFNEDYIINYEISLKTNDRVNEARLDRQMAERGYLVTTGSTRDEAIANWNKTFTQIRYEIN